jgi:hypothetical protein
MEILQAFDLTGSCRAAAELAECSHHTVAHYVRAREEGRLVPGAPAPRASVIDGFLPKLEEQVDRSKGKIRADVADEKLVAMGFAGSERTARRAVAELKRARRPGPPPQTTPPKQPPRPWRRLPSAGRKQLHRNAAGATKPRDETCRPPPAPPAKPHRAPRRAAAEQ